jgi:uncharacterized protein
MKPIPSFLICLFGLSLLLLSACVSRIGPTEEPSMGMPNPASVYCEEQGYQVEIRTAEDGSQSGVCVFPEGECDEWAFFRGECSPPAGMPNPASVYCEEQGYQVEIRTAEDGSQSGVCVFPEGECDEWAFFRGECSPPAGQPDDVIPPAPGGGNEQPDEINRIANVAKEQLAGQLGISPGEILFAALEEASWPDACLGLPAGGEVCAHVITPGYRLTLSVGEDVYYFRTDLNGGVVRQEPVE